MPAANLPGMTKHTIKTIDLSALVNVVGGALTLAEVQACALEAYETGAQYGQGIAAAGEAPEDEVKRQAFGACNVGVDNLHKQQKKQSVAPKARRR